MSVSNAVIECVQVLTPAQNNKTLNSNLRLELANILVRLKIWAGNVGVFAPDNASVDYRLRDDPDLVEVVFSMTRRLKQSLLNAVNPPLLEESDDEDKETVHGRGDDSVSSGSSSASLDLDSNVEESDSDDDLKRLGPSAVFIEEANQVINRLYRLATVFRKPQSSSENAKVQGFIKKLHEKGDVEELEDVEDHAWSHIKAHFPQAPDFLVRRLVKAVVFRRMKIRYRQRHQDKLNQGLETAFAGLGHEYHAKPATGLTLSSHVLGKHNSGKGKDRSLSKPRSSDFSATNASSINRARLADYARSTALSGVTKAAVGRRQQLDVPPPPNNDGQEKIECPYCLRMVNQEEMTQPRWTRHILKDIDPFICLFEDCKESLTLFKTVEEWLGHMQWQHTVVYSCQSVGHEREVFSSPQDLERHIREGHPDTFTESQLPGLVKQGTLPSSSTLGALNSSLSMGESQCLLCHTSDPQPVNAEFTDDTEPASTAEQRMQNHILEHLEAIALLALPGGNGSDGMNSNVRHSIPGLDAEVKENDDLLLDVFEDIASERAEDENVPDQDDHDDFWAAVFHQVKQPHLREPHEDPILIEIGEEKKKTTTDEVLVEDMEATEEKRLNEEDQSRSDLRQETLTFSDDTSRKIPLPEVQTDRMADMADVDAEAVGPGKFVQTASYIDPSSGNANEYAPGKAFSEEASQKVEVPEGPDAIENMGKLPEKMQQDILPVVPSHSPLPSSSSQSDEDYTRTATAEFINSITPDFSGFTQQVLNMNPKLADQNTFLVDRLGHHLVIRYNNLLQKRVLHFQQTITGDCPSGNMCIASGGSAVALGKKLKTREMGSSSSSYEAGSETELSELDFPPNVPVPPIKSFPATFECQICFRATKFIQPSDWTRHVHEDVQPFVCTWDRCRRDHAFKRYDDWARHENEDHRHLEWWTCDIDDCRYTCYQEKNFAQHLVREHKFAWPKPENVDEVAMKREGKHTYNLLSRQVERCHEVSIDPRPHDEPCRFCGKAFLTWEKLTKHMSKHMEDISLPVLRLVEGRELDANITSSVPQKPPSSRSPPLMKLETPSTFLPETGAGLLAELPGGEGSSRSGATSQQHHPVPHVRQEEFQPGHFTHNIPSTVENYIGSGNRISSLDLEDSEKEPAHTAIYDHWRTGTSSPSEQRQDDGDSLHTLQIDETESTDKQYSVVTIPEVLDWISKKKNGWVVEPLRDHEQAMREIKDREQIFIVDDSNTMRKHHWAQVVDTVQALGYLVKHADPDGVELFYTSRPTKSKKSGGKEITSLVRSLEEHGQKPPEGPCNMERSLGPILEHAKSGLTKVSMPRQQTNHRGINIYILTDAIWEGGSEVRCGVEEPIKNLSKTMQDLGKNRTSVGLQFIQFGDDALGEERLRYLDDTLEKQLDFDIVDHRHSQRDGVWHMLVGSISRDLDKDNNSGVKPPSPET